MNIKPTFLLMLALASPAAAAKFPDGKNGRQFGPRVAPKTQDFVTEAAVSDMTEIAAANVALQKGRRGRKEICRPNGEGPHPNQH